MRHECRTAAVVLVNILLVSFNKLLLASSPFAVMRLASLILIRLAEQALSDKPQPQRDQ